MKGCHSGRKLAENIKGKDEEITPTETQTELMENSAIKYDIFLVEDPRMDERNKRGTRHKTK